MSELNILGRWYAEPLEVKAAERLFGEITIRMEKRLRHGGGTLCCRLQLMQAKFWQGVPISDDYEALQHLASLTPHGRALLELVYGQLLLSRQLSGAMEHLERGFDLARHLFTASDYFTVMNRHRLLRQLPLSDTPTHAEALAAMLTSAKVIERMKQPEKTRQTYLHDPKDTYG